MPEGIEQIVGLDDDFFEDYGPAKPRVEDDTLYLPILDVIGGSGFFFGGLSSKKVRSWLIRHDKTKASKIVVEIDSPGGSMTDGVAIYNLLRNDGRPVEVRVLGLAASAASVVMLAADDRTVYPGALVMIHRASTGGWGNRDVHQQRVNQLDAADASMLKLYAKHTTATEDELRDAMVAERWLTADEALEWGFATKATEDDPVTASAYGDEAWHDRRGALLTTYANTPAQAQHGEPLGWDGRSPDDLIAAMAIARAHQLPTFAMALDGFQRARPQAQVQPNEATPPPRQAPPARPATTGGPKSIAMDEETLAYLGFEPGATPTPEQIKAAMKAKAAEHKTLAEAKAKAEATAEAERLARVTAEAKANAEAAQREQAEAKAKADAERTAHEAAVERLVAQAIPSNRGLIESLCWDGEGADRKPRPKGLEQAKELLETNASMRADSLSTPSQQVERAKAATPTVPSLRGQHVRYPTRDGLPPIEISRITGSNQAALAKRRQELVAKYGDEALAPDGYRVNQ